MVRLNIFNSSGSQTFEKSGYIGYNTKKTEMLHHKYLVKFIGG